MEASTFSRQMFTATDSPQGEFLAALFALTLFVSSALLFLAQPMVARMVLPHLGGTPSVWNTCMVFFQALLLAGYAYAHAGATILGPRRQAVLHTGVLLVPLIALPLALPAGWTGPGTTPPILWLLALLSIAVGLPFFVLSTTAPMLQKWFAETSHSTARDPYFLYAASNAGSMLALLAYPLLLEPTLTLSQQRAVWSGGYGVAAALIITCAAVLWSSPRRPPTSIRAESETKPLPLSGGRRARWVIFAFVPSSLLLSVTIYITSDLGAIPLLWVIPLSLYLLSFIVVFARHRQVPQWLLSRALPLVVLVIVLVLLSEATEPVSVLIAIHLVGLLWIGMFCHGALAEDRPDTAHLTEFYLWIAVGGVLGGLFNALVAPLVFSSVLEYPLILVLAALLRASDRDRAEPRSIMDLLFPLALGLVTMALVLGVQAAGVEPGPVSVAAMFAVPAVICYTFLARPLRFGLGIAALLLAGGLYHGVHGRAEHRVRSFFGIHRVTLDRAGEMRILVHGNTVHGRQSLDPRLRNTPLAYYHPSGPIGDLFRTMQGDARLDRVGVVGLGTGALAAYSQPDQKWTFFEIDPAVIHLARDSGYFTYLHSSPAPVSIVPGDARITLTSRSDQFGLLIIDAFSSDSIPVHLLTREAFEVYRSRLAPGGLLVFHISNRYLDLEPLLAALAARAEPQMVALKRDDFLLTAEQRRMGKSPSQWVVVAESSESAGPLAHTAGWRVLSSTADAPVWTDDYSNLLGVFKKD
jgi:hypothetical protein